MRPTRRGLAALTVTVMAAALATAALLSGCAPSSAAPVHPGPRTGATRLSAPDTGMTTQPPPMSMDAWERAIHQIPQPGPGCFTASYPALVWHPVKCGTAPDWPLAVRLIG